MLPPQSGKQDEPATPQDGIAEASADSEPLPHLYREVRKTMHDVQFSDSLRVYANISGGQLIFKKMRTAMIQPLVSRMA